MIDLILLASIATRTPVPTPAPTPVATPVTTPTPKPSYVTPPVPTESWSDKMWKRYKENSK
ncbi:MAG: hypothetical protein EAZ09_06795 [Oscillatoriales cyanobacterium]|nr:MAG: hypothetical protein EAZ18_05750 [Oscillatoriales cyanobacterium]TAH23550.1 MAG: hypothetical protein EAZ09_06795 [Oscillatoriales cyanobacterium]